MSLEHINLNEKAEAAITAPVTPTREETLLAEIAKGVEANQTFDKDEQIRLLKAEIDRLMGEVRAKKRNFLLMTDGYKYAHWKFYAPGTTKIYSYVEARGHKEFAEVLMVGLQYMCKEYLVGQLFDQQDIDEAAVKIGKATGNPAVFNREGFQFWLDNYNAHAPIEIKAAPEGMVVPIKNVLMTSESTVEELAWVTNWLESLLLEIWYPITVATLSREVKKVAKQYLEETSDNVFLDFVLNDFGFRGVSSVQSAEIGGMAHLVNFPGSDNMAASDMITRYYNTDKWNALTIPATEHSIMTQKGRVGEHDTIARVLRTFKSGPVACVMDSFNILESTEYVSTVLKDEILAREGVFILRPDSGDPLATLLKMFEILFKNFGFTRNGKGYKVLPPQVRIIQGDGVNYNSIKDIYAGLKKKKISAENIVFGMGGKLLQADINRDTFNFAFKCSYSIVNGEEINVVKSPTEIDANGNVQVSFKKSKQGRMKLVRREDGSLYTLTSMEPGFEDAKDELVTIFRNGKMVQEYTFEEIQERAAL